MCLFFAVNSYDVQAVQGGIAKLPCDISAPIIGDKIVLVIWFKEGMSTPIYSFDSRGKILDQARHWYDEMTLSGRATFQYNEEPSKLTLNGIKDSDSGTYRCRVDFKSSPSRNQRINLTVIGNLFVLFEIEYLKHVREVTFTFLN